MLIILQHQLQLILMLTIMIMNLMIGICRGSSNHSYSGNIFHRTSPSCLLQFSCSPLPYPLVSTSTPQLSGQHRLHGACSSGGCKQYEFCDWVCRFRSVDEAVSGTFQKLTRLDMGGVRSICKAFSVPSDALSGTELSISDTQFNYETLSSLLEQANLLTFLDLSMVFASQEGVLLPVPLCGHPCSDNSRRQDCINSLCRWEESSTGKSSGFCYPPDIEVHEEGTCGTPLLRTFVAVNAGFLGPLPTCCHKVQHLNLRGNNFSKVPRSLSKMIHLKSLDVSSNLLSSAYPNGNFSASNVLLAPQLEELWAGGNRDWMGALGQGLNCSSQEQSALTVNRTKSLQLLSFRSANLTDFDLRCIKHITMLDFSGNKLRSLQGVPLSIKNLRANRNQLQLQTMLPSVTLPH